MKKITKKQRLEFIEKLIDLSYEAGEILLKFQKKRHDLQISNKGLEGIASEADLASEEFILSELIKVFPEASVLSEEDYVKRKNIECINNDYCWVVDPLDGTNNFVNGIPIYAISIGLLEQGKPILGIVYNPLSGECFYAGKNTGAFLIDFRINPLKKFDLIRDTNSKEMSDCIFSPAPVYDQADRFSRQLSVFKKNIVGARAVRRLGSAALELCYVANGNFDGYWEKSLKPWDVAAALIICAEAKVLITDYFGQPAKVDSSSFIAARNPLHKRILGKLESI